MSSKCPVCLDTHIQLPISNRQILTHFLRLSSNVTFFGQPSMTILTCSTKIFHAFLKTFTYVPCCIMVRLFAASWIVCSLEMRPKPFSACVSSTCLVQSKNMQRFCWMSNICHKYINRTILWACLYVRYVQISSKLGGNSVGHPVLLVVLSRGHPGLHYPNWQSGLRQKFLSQKFLIWFLIEPSTKQTLTHVILIISYEVDAAILSHFTDEKTEAQWDWVACAQLYD